MQNKIENLKFDFNLNHFWLVLIAVVFVFGMSWMKNPSLISFSQKQNSNAEADLLRPKYYAYEPIFDASEAQVAGASTFDGPGILNEDGSISPALDISEVLGVDTDTINANLEQIKINSVADNTENLKNYIFLSSNIEDTFNNSVAFENALMSQDSVSLENQRKIVSEIILSLSKLAVPNSLAKLHKLKIVQYNAAERILTSLPTIENNPEGASQDLGIFLQAQQNLEQEVNSLNSYLQNYAE